MLATNDPKKKQIILSRLPQSASKVLQDAEKQRIVTRNVKRIFKKYGKDISALAKT